MTITPDDPFRLPARISRDAFRRLIEVEAAFPVVQERDCAEYWDAIVAFGVDPLFVAALFFHESGMGHKGVARQTHSWGNTRQPSFGATPIGEVPGASGTFPVFATWLDGCISTAARLVEPTWVYAARTTIRDIFEHPSGQVWAPAGDFNNPAAYLRAVIDFMNAHQDLDSNEPVGRVTRPPMRTDLRARTYGGYDASDGMTRPKMNEAIVYHISDGSEAGDLRQLTEVVSSNYYVNKAGVIYELVPPTEAAWTNGPVRQPDLTNEVIKAWVDNGWNPNTRTITIEHEGTPDDPLTEAQVASTTHLTAWLCERYAIPCDRTHILGHFQIDSVQRAYCPSFSDAEWERLIGGADAMLNPPIQPPDTGEFWLPGAAYPFVLGFAAHVQRIGAAVYPSDPALGALAVFGYPLEREYATAGGSIQRTERYVLQWQRGVAPPFDIVGVIRGEKIPRPTGGDAP